MWSWQTLWKILMALGGVLMAAAGVGPKEAVSNLSQWAEYLPLSRIPEWLSSDSADTWGMLLGSFLVIGSLAIFTVSRVPPAETETSTTTIPSGRSLVLIVLIVSFATVGWVAWQYHQRTQAREYQKRISATLAVLPNSAYRIDGIGRPQVYFIVLNAGSRQIDIWTWEFGIAVAESDVGDTATELAQIGGLQSESGAPPLAPGQEVLRFRELERVLSANELRDIKSDLKRLYGYGRVIYSDASGIYHTTLFCYMYSGREMWEFQGSPAYHATQKKYCKNLNSSW